MSNREKAYTEVYTILQDLVEEEYEKIPEEIIKALDNNRDKEYIFEIYDDIELKEQILLPETKAILFNLFRDYLATPEQKEKIIKMQNEEREKVEQKKREQYGTDVFENKEIKEEINETKEEIEEEPLKEENVKESLELVEYKRGFFERIIGFFKKLFKRK